MLNEMDELKMLIREADEDNRYFSNEELRYYLRRNDSDIEATAYELLLIKAEDDSAQLPNGFSVNSSENYWLRLARKYRPNGSRCL